MQRSDLHAVQLVPLTAFDSEGRLHLDTAAVLAGGNVRVGLEDNLFLEKGVLATNAQLVEKAVGIIEGMGARIAGPEAVRETLGLTKRAPA